MHIHLPGADSAGISTRNTLALLLANGVTTVRVMSGAFRHLALRDSVNRGDLLGPRIYLAGSAVGALPGNTNDMRRLLTRAEVTRFVEAMKRAGYDFIQITAGVTRAEYDALLPAARRAGIPITGGVPQDVGLKRVLEARQSSIENLEGYLPALELDDSPVRFADPMTRARLLPRYFDPAKVRKVAGEMRDAGIANTPTLFLTHMAYTPVTPEEMAKWPEMTYVNPPVLADWMRRKQRALDLQSDETAGARLLVFRSMVAKHLADADALVLIGSDAPSTFLVPGFATLYEIHALTVAGIPLARALRAATLDAARFLHAEGEFGAVAPGRSADLLLLEQDPLLDAANLTHRAGVMVRGRWLPPGELSGMLAGVAATAGVGNARVRDR
jgi:hypothetical protein